MRRARIKALAAVPVRKKPVQDTVTSADVCNVPDKEQKKEDISSTDKSEQEIIKDVAQIEEQKEEDISNTDIPEQEVAKDIAKIKKQKEENISGINTLEQETAKDVAKVKEQKNGDARSIDILELDVVKSVTKIQEKTTEKEQKASLVKAESVLVENPDLQRLCPQIKPDSKESYVQAKPDFREPCAQAKQNSQEPPSQVKPDSRVTRESCVQAKPAFQEPRVQAKPNLQEPRIQVNDTAEEVTDQPVQKNIPLPNVSMGIDIASPTKAQSRPCFMRPIPRLDNSGRVRKNSVQGSGASASESEDEHGKRAASVVVPSRIRNDSICSIQSNKESTTNDNQNNSPRIKTMQKRRVLISESARKLAESRREFLLKHENRTPDRSQLKMYDLIYYNPVTNPMTKRPVERRQVITSQSAEILEEQNEDDPSVMPAPQVKVGPDGQLIVDEQSLVIDQIDKKRSREISANEVIIEDETFHGGFYKKHKRSKDWPKWETFKFYRVLNVVGTDFLLMQTLFPNRTRQEIKQKYKKEERVNRSLVEKALRYHQEFDTEMLEEQLAMLQNLENDQSTPKRTSEKVKNGQRTSRAARRRRHRLVAGSIGECEAMPANDQEIEDAIVSDEMDTEVNSETSNVQQMMKNKTRKKKRLNDRSDEIDNSSNASHTDSDSSPEFYQVRPTRSGRLPRKVPKLQAPDVNAPDSGAENESVNSDLVTPSHVAVKVTEIMNTPAESTENAETSCSGNITTVIPNINQMEPGSLVIVSKESTEDPGNTILQVYMVSSNIDSANTTVTSSGTPVHLSSSEPSMATIDKLENAETLNVTDDEK